jgi:hypothetical protein
MSMSNWKTILEKQNAAAYAWPKGWTSRDDVADQLDCSPDRVASLLAPGIRSGSIERQDFTVWDGQLKRLVRITGYRESAKAKAAPAIEIPSQKVDQAPAAGSKVVSRRTGSQGVVQDDGSIQWESGNISRPTESAWRKGDIRLL